MNNNSTNYMENKDLNKKIRNNIFFSVTSFLLAGIAFGIGDKILGSSTLQYIVAFLAIGITTANIRALKENLKLKSSQKSQQNQIK